MLVNIVRRAQYLTQAGEKTNGSEALLWFLKNKFSLSEFTHQPELLDTFGQLDDNDVWGAIKLWRNHPDAILSGLCNRLLQRDLFQIQLTASPIKKSKIEKVRLEIHKSFGVLRNEANYLFAHGTVSNEAYISGGQSIGILMKNGKVLDMEEASDLPTIHAMSKIVKKNYLCWPKNLPLQDASR
jgi:hypothetical protein